MREEKLALPAYFLVVFGYEGAGNPASESHTFASYVSVDGIKAPRARVYPQSWKDISWLPEKFAKDGICVFRDFKQAAEWQRVGQPCVPVTGTNYTAEQTLTLANDQGRTLGVWGPFRITRAMYDIGLAQRHRLDNRRTQYIADDSDTRASGEAINCMHAVGDIVKPLPGKGGLLGIGWGIWGIKGTLHTLKVFKGLAADPQDRFILDDIYVSRYREISDF